MAPCPRASVVNIRYFIAALTASGVIGRLQSLAPVAANTAFAMAGRRAAHRLADAAQRVLARDDVHLDLRRLAHAQEIIVAEVRRP